MSTAVAVDRAVEQLSQKMRAKRILTTSSSASFLVSFTQKALDFLVTTEARILKSAASLATNLQAGALETLRVCRTGVGLVPPVSTATAVAVGSGVILVGGSIIRRLYASAPSSFVLHLKQAKRDKAAAGKGAAGGEKRGLPTPSCDGLKKRTSGQTKEIMFFCYQEDVRVNKWRNSKITAPGQGLRVMTFNVHFFKSGYSNIEMGGNMEEVLSLVEEYEPDVLCLQEVVVEVAGDFLRGLHALGYLEDDLVTAGCADVHVLPADQPSYASSRLNVALLSRRHRRRTGAHDDATADDAGVNGPSDGPDISLMHSDRVPLAPSNSALADPSPGGYAAFQSMTLDLPGANGASSPSSPGSSPPASPSSSSPSAGAATRRTVAVYTMHLSVRCPPSTRLQEIMALLSDLSKREKERGDPFDLVLIAGDFNQPNKSDYPPSEWALIAEDLKACNLPEDDGVMNALREQGFLPSFEAAGRTRMPVRTTCWNGCVVDYIYSRTREGSGISCAAHDPIFTCASDHLPLISDYVFR